MSGRPVPDWLQVSPRRVGRRCGNILQKRPETHLCALLPVYRGNHARFASDLYTTPGNALQGHCRHPGGLARKGPGHGGLSEPSHSVAPRKTESVDSATIAKKVRLVRHASALLRVGVRGVDDERDDPFSP